MFSLQPLLLVLPYFLQHTQSSGFDYVRPMYSPDVTRNYTLRVERNLCVDQPYKYFKLLACSNRLARNHPSEILFAGWFTTVQETMFCRYAVFYRYQTFQPWLIDEWFNYCEALDNLGNSSSFGQLAIGGLKHSMSYLPGCPLKGLINVTLTVSEAQFPPFLPAGEYRTDMKFYNGQNETLFAVQTYFTVRSKGAVDLAMG